MRIVFLSDTHGQHDAVASRLPDGDVIVHGGDLSRRGELDEVKRFADFMRALPFRHKIIIAGNHDLCFEDERRVQAEALLHGLTYLFDSSLVIDGVRFYGSPWQPRFFDWAFNLDRGIALAEKWALIPDDTSVLITHGPPFGILDFTQRGVHTGCEDLLERVKRLTPRLHLFGHIHEAHGEVVLGRTRFVNGSICDVRYHPCQSPIVVDL